MQRTRLVPPYDPNGRTTFPARERSGVYLIFRRGLLYYVGFSGSDVYKALYRHFEVWNDASRDRARATFPRGGSTRVRVVYTDTSEQAARLETALIVRYRPPGNVDKLQAYETDAADRRIMERAARSPFVDLGEAPF